ncbi:uncharacterized protein DEA37_0011932 [Paragonimus westermani]|uniref:C2H2-type domain-containing protein n=1 Tax=Paragonimus westermani TaxID=34504 RepID=A0A5J4NS33_9TREM|nr:uncharacterized protein DEA37_0011932 [Paragonimus westermani]
MKLKFNNPLLIFPSLGSNRFPCPICDKGFTSDVYRVHHMELVHSDNKEYACVACEENFSTKTALMNHVTSVHGGCEEEREAKAKHEPSPVVLQDKPHNADSLECEPNNLLEVSCTHPNSSDDQPLDLSIRKPRRSSPEPVPVRLCFRLPDCEVQPHSFAEVSSTWDRHNCTYCEKTFASKEYLRLHEATIHEGTKAFICSSCGKHFSVHQALRKHYIIQHEGGKPYRCRDCKMEFRTRATLRAHRSTTHGK